MAMLPTTRRERWIFRKKRYAKRMKRMRRSRPSFFDGGGYVARLRRFGPISFNTDGSPQQSLWRLLRNPSNNYGAFVFPNSIHITTAAYRKPPHIAFDPPLPPHHNAYREKCYLGYHNRPCMRLGHKNNRMTGIERAIYFAGISNLEWKLNGMGNKYPAWDPLHRTPVQDDPDDPFPGAQNWYNHVGPPFA